MADSPSARSDLPTGTVTFLRTDVEGSMGRARQLGTAWDEIVERHLALIAAAVVDYGGFDVNRAARVAAVGHGGQVILSETTAALAADALPAGTALRDLGRHVLKDVPRAERLSQLDIAGLPCEFPPL